MSQDSWYNGEVWSCKCVDWVILWKLVARGYSDWLVIRLGSIGVLSYSAKWVFSSLKVVSQCTRGLTSKGSHRRALLGRLKMTDLLSKDVLFANFLSAR